MFCMFYECLAGPSGPFHYFFITLFVFFCQIHSETCFLLFCFSKRTPVHFFFESTHAFVIPLNATLN